MLKDPYTSSVKKHTKSRSIISTSGHLFPKSASVSFLPNIKFIKEEEITTSESKIIGSGRFCTCYSAIYIHFRVCVKVPKDSNCVSHFINEANILSQFAHKNLPYLFGVCLKNHSIVMSYHGFKDQAVETITLYDVLHPNSAIATLVQELTSKWKGLLNQIIEGCNCLHSEYKVIHNDLKCDNIVVTLHNTAGNPRAIIVDFNKACKVGKGKKYNLSSAEKEKYKKYHHHIAPDLRDGHCYQSPEADIFSLGKIIHCICIKYMPEEKSVIEIGNKCMDHNGHNRPTLKQISNCMTT